MPASVTGKSGNTSSSGIEFNPTVTFLYQSKSGKTHRSMALTEASINKIRTTLDKSLIKGSRLLIKKMPGKSQYGDEYFALEILPPFEGEKTVKRESNEDSEI